MTMPPPSHIAQIAIVVRDVERAKVFYRDRLGLQWLFDAPPGLSFFQCGATRLMLSAAEGPEPAGTSLLYYNVDDIEAAHQALAAAGVAFEEAPRCIARVGDKDVWLAVCRDSEANLVGLMSEPELRDPQSQQPGDGGDRRDAGRPERDEPAELPRLNDSPPRRPCRGTPNRTRRCRRGSAGSAPRRRPA